MPIDKRRRGMIVDPSKGTPPRLRLRPRTAAALTDVRRDSLAHEIERGLVRETGNYAASMLRNPPPAAPPTDPDRDMVRGAWIPAYRTGASGARRIQGVIAHSDSFRKQAASIGTVSGASSATSAGSATERLAPEIYSPLFTMANLNLPRDRITVNAWLRNFYDLHPLVRNAITLHATYPISKISIKCADKRVETFFEDMIEEMDLLGSLGEISLEYWKMGECMPASTKIVTKDGLKRIVDIVPGTHVLTHKGRYRRVTECMMNRKHDEVLSIRIRGVPDTLEMSANHPALAFKVSHLSDYQKRSCFFEREGGTALGYEQENRWKAEWTPAEELKTGDLMLVPVDRRVRDNPRMTKEWCRVFGLWLAEGCFSRNNGRDPSAPVISNYDEALWNDYSKGFMGAGFRLAKSPGSGNGYLRSLGNHRSATAEEAEFMLEHGREFSDGKRLSAAIMLLPPEKQLEIICGFIDGDGWVQRGALCCGTVSPDLAHQFRQILARNWILCSISIDRRSLRDPRRKDLYALSIPIMHSSSMPVSSVYRMAGKRDLEVARRPLRPNNIPRQRFSRNGHILSPIMKVAKRPLGGEPLYNLEVEHDHSYCAEGVAVHNCFPYAELDERTMKWRRIIVQNPDYIHVKKTVVASEPVISLRPDAVLQRLVTSSNPADVQLRRQIPEPILFHVKRGENIPLDNFNVSHLKLLSSPYDVRGTSIIVSTFKDLMLYDKLREAKFAQADGLVNPITLVKVGGTGEGEYHPTPEDLEEWRHIIEEAQYDKDFKIITHHGVTIERVGASGAVLDIAGDMELIIKNIHHGLMVPQAIIDTESAVYASASIGLEVLRQRYFNFRNMLAKWLVNKIFAPISDLQGFYRLSGGMKKLIVPEIEWNHMNLYDLQDYISSISSLVTTKQVSLQTLYRSLGLNYEDERKKLRHEMVNDTIRAREEAALAGMDLTELRSIDPGQEIMPPVPAEGAGAQVPGGLPGMPGGMPPGGGGPLGMPGMPGGSGLPGGLPELAPPPGEAAGLPGAGAPGGGGAGGVTPPLGPGTPGGPLGGGGLGGPAGG